MIRLASSKVNIEDYLPEYQYDKDPNLEWLCGIIDALILEKFQTFVNEKIEKRKEQLIDNKTCN